MQANPTISKIPAIHEVVAIESQFLHSFHTYRNMLLIMQIRENKELDGTRSHARCTQDQTKVHGCRIKCIHQELSIPIHLVHSFPMDIHGFDDNR